MQYDKAINMSLSQLRKIKTTKPNGHDFLDAHILLLEDNVLRNEVIEVIIKEQINAATAFTTVIDNMNTTSIKDILVGISDAIIALFGNFKAIALGLFIGIIFFKYKKHPILYIVIAAILGIILQM